MKLSRYGYRIPSHWIQCKGCSDIVDEDISDIYIYGYCSCCIGSIPNYLPQEQWVIYLESRDDRGKEILSSM